MIYFSRGDTEGTFTDTGLNEALSDALDKIGNRNRVLILPPDFTRLHSRAGELTCRAHQYYGNALTDIMPALGTHRPMTAEEIAIMYPGVPASLFRVHDWRRDCETVGVVPADRVRAISEGAVDFTWPAQVNRLVLNGGHDLILSIGQVVPHEVIGMAGYNKNIFVGLGGSEGIGKSHFLGATFGMERIMGRAHNPVRQMLNFAEAQYLGALPIVYVLTVVRTDGAVCGLFVGDDVECFNQAAELSSRVNITMLDRPLKKVVVYLNPAEYQSMWLGNKSIYRTRMAIADSGELIVMAPGVDRCGEDPAIDALIRRYGYCGTRKVLALVQANKDLQSNLGAAAHLIHGSSEGRFRITYCTERLPAKVVQSVGFQSGDCSEMMLKYPPEILRNGVNAAGREEFFYIANPAMGLWAWGERFDKAG
jgi:nickel-dependent lactate racemase